MIILLVQFYVCIVFLAATFGLGEAMRRFFAPSFSPFFSFGIGLMALLAFQGVTGLGLYFGIYAAKLVVIVGVSLCFVFLLTSISRINRYIRLIDLVSIVLGTLALIPLFISTLAGFNETADKVGYAVHVARFLDVGGYGPDPFNSRIIESGLGGFNYIMGIVAGLGLPLYQLPVVERFIAPTIGLFCLLGFIKDFKSKALERGVLISLYIGVIYLGIAFRESFTLTGTIAALPLCILIIRTFSEAEEGFCIKHKLLLGFLVAAICSLKTTNILNLSILMPILFLFSSKLSFYRRIESGAIVALVALILLLPFMLNLYLSSGTFLYPILGKGYHGSSYGIAYSPTILSNLHSSYALSGLLKTVFLFLPILLFTLTYHLWFHYSKGLSIYRSKIVIVGAVGLFLSALVVVALTGFYRYSYAAFFMSLVVLLLDLKQLRIFLSQSKLTVLYACISVLAVFWIGNIKSGLGNTLRTILVGVGTGGNYGEVISQATVRSVQSKVPPGELILARMGQAYFLDFERNPIWHIDIPGVASPPPGLPLGHNASSIDLSGYLKSLGINYLMYSELDSGGHPISTLSLENSEGWRATPWMLTNSKSTVEFDHLIHDLMLKHPGSVYKDNGLVLLKLTTGAESTVSLRKP